MRALAWRKSALAAALCGVPTILGCAQSDSLPPLDVGALRCPPLAARDVATLAAAPMPPPPGDIDERGKRAWVDGLRGQVRAMNKAGGRLVWEYGRCRAGDGSAG